MFDGGCPSEVTLLQRAVGELHVAFKRFGAETVLQDLRQVGCLKARFPRRVTPGWIDMVMLNTGGGVAGGDRLDVSVDVAPGCQATLSAQSADRFYRALVADAPSQVRTRLTVEADAALEWLPQETILFDRSALDRRLEIDLADNARFLGVETVVFGRTAMGERVQQGWLRDLVRLKRSGELLLHDAVRIDGPIDELLRRTAIGAGAVASATLIYAAPDAAARLDAVRAALGAADAATSVWNAMLVARILGADSASVRATVIAVLATLRDDRPLPRVWFC
ncbi:urease accessory protein UreD [Rhodopila sp.]|uniref:urease accessory protein UreD n=1 Tax=Rhodopila sp. TaxID=2480087 RepID=UPI003D11D671